jgi:hypothetical protein
MTGPLPDLHSVRHLIAAAERPHALAEQAAVTVGGPDAGASGKASRRAGRGNSLDKSFLLWIDCREIAPFETPTFSSKVGEIIARATRPPQK